jgi:glycosyltransferase involved in cell wall biosynthesis
VKIAVIWMRFGAYHLARLRGLAAFAAPAGHQIIGLEVASQDLYAWELQTGAEGFARQTLFTDRAYQELSAREIRSKVLAALNQLRPNAVAVNGWAVPEARAAMAWCQRNKVPVVLMSETKADDGAGARSWWKERVKSWLVQRCDSALVGGRAQAEYLTTLGFPYERIFLGYDAVDNDYFAAGAARVQAQTAQLRAQAGLPEKYFFACTRFLPRKNIDGLLRGYSAYRVACLETGAAAPWDLVIAGSGDEDTALRELATRLRIDGVQWAGFVRYNRLPLYFGLASAFVHPAKAEPWGLVVNEAAASGLPLLVGRTVGAGYELVQDGVNGWRFNASNDEDITHALLAVASLPEEKRAALGRRSYEIVADWGPQRFARGLLDAVGTVSAH